MVIELRHLRHLLAVAEHGNFSRAADALHITQPALSRSIQTLEAHVGATLFERNRGGALPTEIGRLLLRHAQSLDTSTRDLDREIRLTKGIELGELRIGVGPFGGSALIGPVVGRLNRQHPRLGLRLVVAPWQELPERARARDVDLVVAELSEIEKLDDFESQALSVHPFFVVCRAGHPLASMVAPGARDLFGYPLAGPRLPAHAIQALMASAPPAAREAALRGGLLTIECDSSTVLKSILIESDAVSTMPRFMTAAELRAGTLVELPAIDLGLRARFGAAWLRSRSMSGAGRKFIELLLAHDAALAADRAPPRAVKKPAPSQRAQPGRRTPKAG